MKISEAAKEAATSALDDETKECEGCPNKGKECLEGQGYCYRDAFVIQKAIDKECLKDVRDDIENDLHEKLKYLQKELNKMAADKDEEIERLRKDKKRIDWLNKQKEVWVNICKDGFDGSFGEYFAGTSYNDGDIRNMVDNAML